MKVFNNEIIDFEKEPLFLGKGRNIARLDLPNEVWIEKHIERQLGKMWFKNDFTYIEDGKNFNNMGSLLTWFFLENLNFQTLLDSVATRTVLETFMPVTTQPKLELNWVVHGFFESIHSQTYAEIIKALPINAKKKFDEIMVNPDILRRAKVIVEPFNHTVRMNSRRELSDEIEYSESEHKKSIVMSLYALNILEAFMFQTSFVCTFAFSENGMMESSAKAVGKIKMDEDAHVATTHYLINRLKKDPEWAFAFNEQKDAIYDIYNQAMLTDRLWIKHLFSKGARLLGLNETILIEYSNYNLYKTMSAVGLTPLVEKVKNNPCSWADKYSKLSNNQNANNESDGAAYLLGMLDKQMTNEDWECLP